MTQIQSLQNISFEDIYKAFSCAFKDYEMQLNKNELANMLKRRGFVPELSFAAFEGDEIISFTLNGIGNFNGLKTAYDTGTGTLEAFRGKGLASSIFKYSIPFLKEQGISQYLLEVLQHNKAAVSIYEKAGFKISREFNYSIQQSNTIKLNSKAPNSDYTVMPIDFPDKEILGNFWDFYPSWQNSFESIYRQIESFKTFAAFIGDCLVGYCIFNTASGDITQIAVNKNHRRMGIATSLLKVAIATNQANTVKMINTETSCNSISQFLHAIGFSTSGKQFEMIKQL